MVTKLAKTASGQSHLRWVRRILANIDADQKHNYRLTPVQNAALASERDVLAPLVVTLAGAVGPYRTFLDEAYLEVRAAQTVADYLCDEAQREANAQLQPRRKDLDALFVAQPVPGAEEGRHRARRRRRRAGSRGAPGVKQPGVRAFEGSSRGSTSASSAPGAPGVRSGAKPPPENPLENRGPWPPCGP
jgi:hypothetical protein